MSLSSLTGNDVSSRCCRDVMSLSSLTDDDMSNQCWVWRDVVVVETRLPWHCLRLVVSLAMYYMYLGGLVGRHEIHEVCSHVGPTGQHGAHRCHVDYSRWLYPHVYVIHATIMTCTC
jgi:hypothetical protein